MILSRLKTETKELHERVERSMDLLARLQSQRTYADLLVRMHGLYAPLEAKLATSTAAETIGLDFEDRRKTPLLRADLMKLGWAASAIDAAPQCSDLPNVANEATALGCMYVLEGATLGGQIIRKELAERLGIDSGNGGSFFTGYGPRTGAMWTEFCEAITAYALAVPDANDAIVASASETFERFDRWLSAKGGR